MPYTLKTQQIAVKDPDTGVYSGVDILTEQTTEGLLTEIIATGNEVKTDVAAQMATERSDFNTYVSGKEAELDQYKSTTETNINTYVTNKNQEIATMIADADEDVGDLEDRKQDVATAVAGMLDKGVDNSLTTANVPAESKAVGDLFETIVEGKSTQPNDKWNRLWIKPSAIDYEIPTMDDLDELNRHLSDVESTIGYNVDSLATDGLIELIQQLRWENGNIDASGEDANNTRKDFVRTIGYYKPKSAVKVTLQKNSLTSGIVYLIYSAPSTLETRTVISGSSKTITLNPQKYYRFCVTAKNSSAVIDLKNVSEYASFNMDMLQFVGGVNSLAQTQTLLGHNGVTVVNSSGPTNSGTKIEITDFPIHIKKEHGYTFYMAFSTTFSKLKIGQGYQQVRGKWLEIDDTNVVVKQWTDAGEEYQAGSVEHGLSISKQLYVSFNLQNDGKANVTITSISGSYSREFNFGLETTGNYFFIPYQNIGNYMMTVVSGDLRKPLWIFGDSYFSMYDNRIGGQIKNFGYSNGIMINAYPGRTSASAVTELQKCLNFGTPKYLVWCMGMNDGTEAAYEAAYDTVAALCKEKNITLILYRLPSVEAKLTVNEEINTFVISTGLRYVNAYRAVTNGTAGVWYDDMQASDGIHPTELGAKMLASRLLADVPEILEY